MKTINTITTKIITPILILGGITFNLTTSYARMGGEVGNGDNDSAFALQSLANENPKLSPKQILLKAFDESYGRIPDIEQFREKKETEDELTHFYLPDGGLYTKKVEFLLKGFDLNELLLPYIDIPLNRKYSLIDGTEINKDNGPLLPTYNKKTTQFGQFPIDFNLGDLEISLITNSKQAVTRDYNFSGLTFVSSEDNYARKWTIEFRQYNENIVIYKLKYESKNHPEFNCDDKPDTYVTNKQNLHCLIGYAWKK